ncbi:MAG: hypothetical protein ABI224_10890 [Acetobacteraceae bacterium]
MQTGVIARQSAGVARRLATETPLQEVLADYLDAAIDSKTPGAPMPAT